MLLHATDGLVVRAGVSVTWNVLSWSGGHEFEPWSGRTWGAWYFCRKSYLNQIYNQSKFNSIYLQNCSIRISLSTSKQTQLSTKISTNPCPLSKYTICVSVQPWISQYPILSCYLSENRIITTQWEVMGDVRSARYEPALLPPCPTIRVLSYSNC